MLGYNNNFENRDGMYQYGFQGGELNQAPAPKNKRQHNGRAVRAAKRIGAITLSAVLFGGVAAGTFQAVNYAAGSAAYAAAAADGTQSGSALQEGQESFGTLQTAALSAIQTAKGNMDVSDIAESVMPSIVSITNKSVQEIRNYFSMFGYVGQSQLMETESAGSGFIIGKNAEELLIVTNCHVINGSRSCSVLITDSYGADREYRARLVGYDRDVDLAVLKVGAPDLPAAEFGVSDDLQVGEPAYAIGNPLGIDLRSTMTSGIISAINRDVDVEGVTMTLIQTDAALNSGNSGGPLINQYGQVVGINTIKMMSEYDTIEGLGFAIPSSLALRWINELIAFGELQPQPVLGISIALVPTTLPDGNTGLEVAEITPGLSGDLAGVRKGDCVVAFNGQRVYSTEEILAIRRDLYVGDEVAIRVYRDGEYLDLTMTMMAE